MPSSPVKVAILGTGNIGTDLMFKLLRQPGALQLALFAGVDPKSDGLARARNAGVATTDRGIDAILEATDIKLVFDATSARAHLRHAPALAAAGRVAVDLTPAACGPCVVPPVNLRAHLDSANVNLITCGGQATIPLVHAVSRVTPVSYAEIVSTVASASAGPGTRQNIDEFTFTTARGLEALGGATAGKAIIILNPADPPILMRNTVYLIPEGDFDDAAVTRSIEQMVSSVAEYVPGYRLKSAPVFDTVKYGGAVQRSITLLLEVEGAGDYLPKYAGNLDIMTAAAWRVGQVFAAQKPKIKAMA
ncbi:MAG: acetaldehyde dehydrogenase (acetylating) [Opitutaceae bacterium]|nr:acetaldehyde dehydrogenase (acetylating) [Opitutaceae bacterium]